MKCPTCGTDILEHPAGRCLDAWVAERLMGAKIASYIQNGVDVKAELYPDNTMRILRSYSTSIADAWEAAEKIVKDSGYFNLAYTMDGNWVCDLDYVNLIGEETASMAICVSAILFTGGGVM